jgi:hypothetical protein
MSNYLKSSESANRLRKKALQRFAIQYYKCFIIDLDDDTNYPASTIWYKGFYTSLNYIPYTAFQAIDENYRSPFQLNNQMYRSFEEVAKTSDFELIGNAINHYYLSDINRILDTNFFTFPAHQQRDLPLLHKKDVKLTILTPTLLGDFECMVMDDLSEDKPRSAGWVEDVISLKLYTLWSSPKDIGIREVRCAYYLESGQQPDTIEDLFRTLVYRATGKPELIKSRDVLAKLKAISEKDKIIKLIRSVDEIKAAESFYRLKEYWLAVKSPRTANTINRIRKRAPKYHRPYSPPVLKNLVQTLATTGDTDKIRTTLANATTSQLLAAFKSVRTHSDEPRIYSIRNGSTWVDTEMKDADLNAKHEIGHFICVELKKRLNVSKVYIPGGIQYGLPISEKQMTGNIPWGTLIEPDFCRGDPLAVSVSWNNLDNNERVDIDLHLADSNNASYGWDSNYKSKDLQIIYSGDIVDAGETGATESFYISSTDNDVKLMVTVSQFTDGSKTVPYTFTLSSHEIMQPFQSSYSSKKHPSAMVDPSHLLAPQIPMAFREGEKQQLLGVVHKGAFTLYGGSLSKKRTSKAGDLYNASIDAILAQEIYLNDLLLLLGVNVIVCLDPENPHELDGVLDLSPEKLTPSLWNEIWKEKA